MRVFQFPSFFSHNDCRRRLEANAEEWSALLKTIQELLAWIMQREEELRSKQPIGGDYNTVQQQHEEQKVKVQNSAKQ